MRATVLPIQSEVKTPPDGFDILILEGPGDMRDRSGMHMITPPNVSWCEVTMRSPEITRAIAIRFGLKLTEGTPQFFEIDQSSDNVLRFLRSLGFEIEQ